MLVSLGGCKAPEDALKRGWTSSIHRGCRRRAAAAGAAFQHGGGCAHCTLALRWPLPPEPPSELRCISPCRDSFLPPGWVSNHWARACA